MKDMIIVDGRKYFHRDDRTGVREQITAKQADKIFRGWKDAGLQVHRHYGRFTHVWVDLEGGAEQGTGCEPFPQDQRKERTTQCGM